MDRGFARVFYSSGAWRRCRALYSQKVGGLCEECLKKGLIVPGTEVHHKIHLTPENVNDPNVALNFDNLELLCGECHKNAHRKKKRYSVGSDGTLTISE